MPNLLPAGFVAHDTGKFRVVATALELQEMRDLLGRARAGEPLGDRVDGGRGGVERAELPGGKRVFVRRYLRGGMARHFVRDLYLIRPERPFRELVVTEAARAAGCAVPTIVAVAVQDIGLFYRGWLVTEAIEGAQPLFDAWVERDEAGRATLLGHVGEAIAQLHGHGIYHVDLTGHNVVVRPDGEPVILDFDRGFFAAPDDPNLVKSGLDRFWRSMRKLGRRAGVAMPDNGRDQVDVGRSFRA